MARLDVEAFSLPVPFIRHDALLPNSPLPTRNWLLVMLISFTDARITPGIDDP